MVATVGSQMRRNAGNIDSSSGKPATSAASAACHPSAMGVIAASFSSMFNRLAWYSAPLMLAAGGCPGARASGPMPVALTPTTTQLPRSSDVGMRWFSTSV